MKTRYVMIDRILDYLFPIGGGSAGGILGAFNTITWGGVVETALNAAIFAIVGGVLGYAVKVLFDRLFKHKKTK